MSKCQGEIAVGTKVDRTMREFVEDEAARLGVSRAEFFRRLLETHRRMRAGMARCERCEKQIAVDLER